MAIPKPASPVESEIFELFKEYDPSGAYISGLNEYAGKIFVPSKRNLEKFSRRVDELRLKAENKSQLKVLDSIAAWNGLGEPHMVVETVLNAYFGYMIKEGINDNHMKSLTRNGIKAIETATAETAGRDWPTGLRLLALIRCDGLQEILRTVKKETQDKQLKEGLDDLSQVTRKYASIFRVKGFKNQGFDEVYKIIKKQGADLGRKEIYGQALQRLWDYSETPDELEAKGLKYLDRELPKFQRMTAKLAKKYGVAANAEKLSQAIKAKRAVKVNEVISYLTQLRKIVVKVANKSIVKVNPKYAAKVIETPPYLTAIFPSGGAFFYDTLTDKPQQLFICTTDPRRDPSTAPGELLNLLVHEEYGHCVHASNSALGYGAKPTLVDMLWSPLGGAVTEGISFQREIEFQDVLEKMKTGKGLSSEEKAFVKFYEKHGGFDNIVEEYEFYTWMWRIVRFLRIIGDARINSGKQGLVEFIEWASKRTGLSKSMVYHQLFPAHQGNGPGYASTYAIVGESIREIQNRAVRNGKKLLDFNTYACSMGFPARTIFEDRLRAFATK
ncbi:MAG: hypothetical protein AUI50_03545 [Crenarchaeota archaeon 13_1_40CM_2_52_14]|nr:MAG: hypothetical protein AUI97_06785 [Crenarchaeota archaeon 13_1_40CM_3_52_17]OLD35101.1 MAG: hypothetical protein AUI50_03545 [Crenarchaeota archaeon 13_1_40CM_2_52_14]OLE68096.1 MAG: hypothetical protein AUF78_17795 [archaeon 13_1_20CM_2_51_12]